MKVPDRGTRNPTGIPLFKSRFGRILFVLGTILFCGGILSAEAASKTSISSGNWNTAATWSPSGVPAAGDTVIIVSPYNVTVTANIAAAPTSTTIDMGGTLTVNANFTVSLGSVVVNGTYDNKSAGTRTITSMAVGNGGSYKHSQDAGSIPTATWNTGSICEIAGNNGGAPSGLGQSFYNFTWNSTGQGTDCNLAGALTTINGNFTVTSTGSKSLALLSSSTPAILNVGGDLIVNDTLNLAKGPQASGGFTLNLAGNISLGSGSSLKTDTVTTKPGTIHFTGLAAHSFTDAGSTISGGIIWIVDSGSTLDLGTQIVTGDIFTLASGSTLGIGSASGIASTGAFGNIQTTTRNFNPAAHYIYNGTTAQFTSNGLPATVTGNVIITNSAGVTLNRATTLTNLTLGVGKFTAVSSLLTMARGGLITRYTGWISAAPTFGATIGVSYQGIIGVTNGPELPFSPTVLTNLTLNNSGDLILATNVTVTNGVLTLTSGDIVTGTNQINLSTNAVTVGASSNSYIRGNLQKAFSTGSGQSFTYPIGDTNYTPVSLAALNVTTAGTLLAKTTAGDHPGTTAATNGLNSAKSVNRYWTLTASGLVVSACDPTFSFQSGDVDSAAAISKLVTRRYSGSAWAATSTGARGSTSTGATNLTAFGDFAIGEQIINGYTISATSPQTAGVAFNTTVTARDILNQTVPDDSATSVAMTSSGSAQFDSDGNGMFGDTNKTLASGTFTISTKDTVAQTVTVTATDGNSKTGLSGNVGVTPAAASQLVFTTAPVTNTAGAVSATLTVQRRDAFGNTNTADANRTVTLSSSSAGPVTFTPASPLILTNGFSSVSFTYQDSKAGTPTITAASTSPSAITSATQVQQIIKATPTISGVTASQSIAYGTPTVTLSGTVSADGPLYPTNGEVVTMTINGLATNASVAGGAGAFSVAFPTATVPNGVYAVTYAYAGDANLNGVTNGSTTLTISRGTPILATSPVASGIVYGQTLASSVVTGGVFTNLAGAMVVMASTNFVYPTRVPNVGVTNVLVTFTPGDTANYTVATNTVSVTVGKASLTQALTSSANPAAAGSSVTFTLTLGAVAPGAGTPTGSVNFRIDGSVAGSGTLTAGIASYSTASLSHTTHTVVAEYAGDGNFLGTTNALAPDQNINSAPVAGSDSLVRYATQGVKVRLATLETNDSDVDSDALSVVVSSTSASNATVTVVNGWVSYTPLAGFTNADSFTYTINDGHGGSATNTVAVGIQVDNDPSQNLIIVSLDNNSVLIQGSGIPGRTYRMQYRSPLVSPLWQDLSGAGSLSANAKGWFQFADTSGTSAREYRSIYP